MSRQAVAAVLARDDLACGERLVALSLASFAGRESRAWPGTAAAAARAGLGRSRYLEARERLVGRGLVVVEAVGCGRGRSSTVWLAFAEQGPWWDGDLNVELLERVLGGAGEVAGPARLLLAVLAALADESGTVAGVSTDALRAAAGLADRTYRRARQELLESGVVEVVGSAAGGRGCTNVWRVSVGASASATHASGSVAPRRPAVPVAVRQPPLLGVVDGERSAAAENPGQERTDSNPKRPGLTGVAGRRRPVVTGVPDSYPGHDRTLSAFGGAKTPAQTPAETPVTHVRAGEGAVNPRTGNLPPDPPAGGTARSVTVEMEFVSEQGRRRRRPVRVDLDEVRDRLRAPDVADRSAWLRVSAALLEAVGEGAFGLWIEPLALIAVDATTSELLVVAPAGTARWVAERFSAALADAAARAGRRVRLASEPERLAMDAVQDAGGERRRREIEAKEAVRW